MDEQESRRSEAVERRRAHLLEQVEVPSVKFSLDDEFLELMLARAIRLDNLANLVLPLVALLGESIVGGRKRKGASAGRGEVERNGGVSLEEVDEMRLEE